MIAIPTIHDCPGGPVVFCLLFLSLECLQSNTSNAFGLYFSDTNRFEEQTDEGMIEVGSESGHE